MNRMEWRAMANHEARPAPSSGCSPVRLEPADLAN